MAPEQSEGREVGEEADLYSLALVLYEALCGRQPGPRRDARGHRAPHRPAAAGRSSASRRDLPRALTRALDAALAPAPARPGHARRAAPRAGGALEHGLGARRAARAAARTPRSRGSPERDRQARAARAAASTRLPPRARCRNRRRAVAAALRTTATSSRARARRRSAAPRRPRSRCRAALWLGLRGSPRSPGRRQLGAPGRRAAALAAPRCRR